MPWNQGLLNAVECHSRSGTVGDAVLQGHEYGSMQLESKQVLSCKLWKAALLLLAFNMYAYTEVDIKSMHYMMILFEIHVGG